MASLQLLSFFRNGDKIVSYLLYCILNSPKTQSPVALVGVDGQPIFLLSNDGLSATVSKIQHPHISYNISWLLAYKQVIEVFHNDLAIGGVIPMRYGYLFKERSQVIQILKKCRVKYISLLKELEGCVEMGIRVLISDRRMRNAEYESQKLRTPQSAIPGPDLVTQDPGKENETCMNSRSKSILGNPSRARVGRNPQSVAPGKAYLAARKAHYSQRETFSKEMCRVINRCHEAFAGLFVKCKTEQSSIINHQSSIQDPMLSLYFLVQKGAVDAFRKAFRHIHSNGSARLLLSGPWPPYNFVQLEYNDRNESMIGGIE
jgi:hypothetical protein